MLEIALERTRFVVDPGVQNTRIVTRLMEPDRRLFLDHRQAQMGVTECQVVRRRQSDDATA